MAGVCKIILIGNLTRDPESKQTNGGEVCKFSVAVNEYKDETEFFNCVAFGKTAGVASQYLKKGKSVYVEGRLKTNKWTDKEGNERKTIDVIVNNLTMLGGSGTQTQNDKSANSPPTEKDLPW